MDMQAALTAHSDEAAFLVDATDPLQPIIACNPALSRLYGYPQDKLRGNSWTHLHSGPEDDTDHVESLDRGREAIRDGTACVLTLLSYRQDGQVLHTRVRFVSLEYARTDNSSHPRLMGVIETDITELQRLNRMVTDQQRLLTARSAILRVFAEQPEPDTLYRHACVALMQNLPELRAWVALPGQTDAPPILMGLTSEPGDAEPPPITDNEAAIARTVAESLASGRICGIEELSADEATPDECLWAERTGVRSMLALPLGHGGRRTAALILFAPKSSGFGSETLICYQEIVDTINLGFVALERERELRLTRDFYAAVSEINRLITRRPDPDTLFEGLCTLILDHASMDAIWVGLLQPDLRIRVVACATAPDLEFDPYALDLSAAAGQPSGHGPAGRAIRTGRMQVVKDLTHDEHFSHWRSIHSRSELRAVAAFPFKRGGEIVGVVSVSSRQPDLFSAPLVDLMQRLAHNITFGLDDYDRGRNLEYLALHDPMTGLHNRSVFQDRLHQMLHEVTRQPDLHAVALLDLDDFKSVNDHFGHGAGDHLLTVIAQRLRPILRAGDTLARLGGDEFGLLLPGVQDVHMLRGILDRMLNAVKQPVELPDGSQQGIGASIGVSTASSELTTEDLLKRADYALYRVKSRGGHGYAFFDTGLEAEIHARNHVRNNFTNALHAGQIVLYYQPQIDLLNDRVLGAEVLVRWQDGDRVLPPDQFIGEVESDTELSRALGLNILLRAADQLDTWSRQGLNYDLNVNIGLKHLAGGHFTEDIDEVIARYPRAAGHLGIEITEREALGNPERVGRHLEWAARRGVRAHLDDFGTAYATLEWLQALPIAGIKLDVRFVRGILENPHNLGIAASMSVLAMLDDLHLVAEGIENRAERDMLLDLGIRYGQGYYFSPALPIDEFDAWTAAHEPGTDIAASPAFDDLLGLQVMVAQVAAVVHLFELALELQPAPPVLLHLLNPGKLPLIRWLGRQMPSGMNLAAYDDIRAALERLLAHAAESLQTWQHDPAGLGTDRIDELQDLLGELHHQARRCTQA
ncbi:hypothetical protein BJI67_00620 [Acidihalobacter aeolianus]|uniref:Diguanylate cyclase n=1 Tax=Acidihalobacter aeolianus TaxID=2792603 RepID=A0A1D8K472_9GAMM|nr:EAL domain-containing protein [Acidihalobacter aeolianus]AOV15759.1 hypothetical protein BJI67_00620 [Acidihalobacter aeolianus]